MIVGIDIRVLSLSRGGPRTYAKYIIKDMASLSQSNSFILFNSSKSNVSWDNVYENIREIIVRIPQRWLISKYFWDNFTLPFCLKSYKVDIFLALSGYVPSKLKIPSVLVIHDAMFWNSYEPIKYSKNSKLYGKEIIFSCNNASSIATVSEFSKTEILKTVEIKENLVRVTCGGVDEIFHPIKSSNVIRAVLNRLKIPDNYILFVGNFYQWKNIEGLLKTFLIFRESHQNVNTKLVIVGSKGVKFSQILQLIPSSYSTEVIFTGHIDHEYLPFVYNGAICFLNLSYFEAFGLPNIEAMACGIPVISSNRTAMPEICGSAALYVDPDDHINAVKLLDKIIFDQQFRNKMIDMGLEHIEKYSWQSTASDTLKILEETLLNSR